jgi:hypothetical protein
MTLHVSLDCWWVPILDKPIYNDVLFQNFLFLPSKKIHVQVALDQLLSHDKDSECTIRSCTRRATTCMVRRYRTINIDQQFSITMTSKDALF